jgi:hypothetical protein
MKTTFSPGSVDLPLVGAEDHVERGIFSSQSLVVEAQDLDRLFDRPRQPPSNAKSSPSPGRREGRRTP